MDTYTTELNAHANVAERTMAFHFKKPDGFEFKPGQAVDVILGQPGTTGDADTESSRHTFSLVNAPFQDELIVATRMRDSAFKRALGALQPGQKVTVEGPSGSLTLSAKSGRPAVFLAGGIGITPFVSMLKQAAHDGTARRLTLLYSNRRPEDAAFLDELQQLEQQNPNFRLIATMTDMQASRKPWAGPTDLIDDALIKKTCASLSDPIFYVAGPPAMVESLRSLLSQAGIDDDDIRSEDFFGY